MMWGRLNLRSLEPGAYRISETAGPLGYDTIAGDYEFVVGSDGKIQYQGKTSLQMPTVGLLPMAIS